MEKEKKAKKNDVDIKTIVEETAKEVVAELLKEKAEKKATTPNVIVEKKLSAEEKAIRYLKAVYENDRKGIAEYGHKDVTTGSVTIPQEWANQIERYLGEGSVARNNSNVVTMTRNTLNVPKISASGSAYWVGEGSDITESAPTFANTQLVAKKLAGYVEVSPEVIEDMNADIIASITADMVDVLSVEETNQWLNGDGSAPAITGALQSSDATAVTMGTGDTAFDKLDGDDLVDLVNAVPSRYRQGAAFFMSDYVFGLVRKLKDSSNRPLYQALTEAERGQLLGYPVVITQTAPDASDSAASTPFILFGNTKRGMLFGNRKSISIEMSRDFKFQADMVALKVIERIDMAVHMGSYMAKLVTAAS